MASKDREKLRVVFTPEGPELSETEKLKELELIKRIHLLNNGREIKRIKNKKILKDIVENIPKDCPVCHSDFFRDNFYLIERFYKHSTEVHIECFCKDHTVLVNKDHIKPQSGCPDYKSVHYIDYRNPDYVGLENSSAYKELEEYLRASNEKIKKNSNEISKEEIERVKTLNEGIKFLESLDRYEKKKGLHIYPDKTEAVTIEGKAQLEEILINLPKTCPICKSDFNLDNFYLITIFDGCGSEVYIECLNGDYREVVRKYDP